MSSLSFPDINVWMALLLADHVHRPAAVQWWNGEDTDAIGFCRFTQLGVLRLLTTPATMNGKPLTMDAAWKAFDRLFDDDRVVLMPEPHGVDTTFRKFATGRRASPKMWADAYLLAFTVSSNASLITFDRALAGRSPDDVLLLAG